MRVEPEIVANEVASGEVSLAFHHVIDHGEPSRLAHRAAECAGAQTPIAFWQMHDILFARQGELWRAGADTLTGWANELGLDGEPFAACMQNDAMAAKVERMDQARRDAGIRLRPTFDINGRIVEGALPYAGFQEVFAQVAP